MAMVISRPTMGSAQAQPAATPAAASRTARLVNPSVRAWRPSATNAAEPIRRPTRIRYRATSSLPAEPTSAAAATAHRWVAAWGWISRVTAVWAAKALDRAIIATTNSPARSSARP